MEEEQPERVSVETTDFGLSRIPNQCHTEATRQGTSYNLLVAGAGFTGKSTFIETLLNFTETRQPTEEPKREESLFHEVCDMFCTNNPLADLLEEHTEFPNPEHMGLSVTTTTLKVEERGYTADVTVYEVSGIGDSVDSHLDWVPIRNMIMNRFEEHHMAEERGIEGADKRIHACVYFLEPRGAMREIDAKTMKEIGKICNLIPVISKADCLTEEEYRAIKGEMARAMTEQGISLFDCILANETKKVVELKFLPLRIICGEKRAEEESKGVMSTDKLCSPLANRMAGVREYPWGKMAVDDESSDLGKLRCILVKSHAVDLMEMTEKYYEEYRTNKMVVEILTNPQISGIDENFRRNIRLEESKLNSQIRRIREKKQRYEEALRGKERKLRGIEPAN